MFVGLLYLFDVPTFSSSLINFNQTYASPFLGQVGRNIVIQEEEVWFFLHISYLMLPVEGSLGLLAPGKAHTGLLVGHPGGRTWPLCPLTLVERVAAILRGESEPWPGFRGKGDSGVPQP